MAGEIPVELAESGRGLPEETLSRRYCKGGIFFP